MKNSGDIIKLRRRPRGRAYTGVLTAPFTGDDLRKDGKRVALFDYYGVSPTTR